MAYKWFYQTPEGFDDLWLKSDGVYLTGIWFTESRNVSKGVENCEEVRISAFDETVKWLDIYFAGREPDFVPAYKIEGASEFRKEVIASSIAPVNAALTAELTRQWMKEGAQILDPFCGVGTMLIERNKAVPAGIMYGIDIYGEAVEKARSNGAYAGCRINYINKDFMEFEHGYLFDEVITNLPQVTAQKSKQEIGVLYSEFLNKISKHLKNDAVLILYVQEALLWKDALRKNGEYHVEKRFLINEKNETSVYVITRKKKEC